MNNLGPENFSQAELDTVEKLSKLFIHSAKTTFGTKRSRNIKEEKIKVCVSKKPWFGLNCKFARQNYKNLKSRHRRNKTESSKLEMKNAEKEHKKLLDTSIINHRKEMRQKMKELRSKNSKQYWKILNSGIKSNQIFLLAHFLIFF